MDVDSAAKRLNLSAQQIRSLCRSGKISAELIGNTWVVQKEEIEKYYDSTTCGLVQDKPATTINENTGYTALSFFSGAMGLDTGLEAEGFNVRLASEIDNACRKTIYKNKPNIGLIGDIGMYSPDEILKFAGLHKKDKIDLIIGGPPCQAFSTAGKRKGFEDKRGNVFLTYIDIITALRPRYAVIENVRGLLSAPLKHRPHIERGDDFPELSENEKPGKALQYIITLLRKAGYGISFNLYNAANFGTPQKRERIVMVCSRDGKRAPYLTPTNSESGAYGLPKWKTLKDAIGDIQDIEHHYICFPEKRLKYYRMLKEGQNWKDLPIELQKKALGASFYSGGGKTGFLRRLAWDEPSPTLVTHPAMPATDLAHPKLDRPLSVEEYKRIQEFPKPWIIEGSLLEQYKQIGNAVPHSLGRAIGRHIRSLLEGNKIEIFEDFPYSRYKGTSDLDFLKSL